MKFFAWLMILSLMVLLFVAGCGDDDDDDDSTADPQVDDDDNDAADDDDDDDSSGQVLPTTLDLTLVPFEDPLGSGNWTLGEGPGETHIERNDLGVYASKMAEGDQRLSLTYFFTVSDLHQTDEEAPTRLTFFDSDYILLGMFEAAYRPQEDLGSQLLNALVRTVNRLQVDYQRNFDFALMLGDGSDNAQYNELSQFIDVLDADGQTSEMPKVTRVDSGDLNIDEQTGFNLGERDFGIQEFNKFGENINLYNRPGYPNSNADVITDGLRKGNGQTLPWFYTPGNHDVLNTGNFVPSTFLSFYSKADFVSDMSSFGFIPGLPSAIKWLADNPGMSLHLDGGLFGIDLDWADLYPILNLLGLIDPLYLNEIEPRFDLMVLANDTPDDGSDDGVLIASDPDRAFMGLGGVM